MDIYQHFRKEEEPFIDQVLSWKEQVEKSYQYKLTDFLDPREQRVINMLIGEKNTEIKWAALPNEHAERKRIILAPFYDEIEEEDFQLSLLEATYPVKFAQIEHKDVMGAFLSLGIERKKLGDIVVDNGIIQLVTANEITPYITANLTSIKKATVQFKEVPLSQIRESQDEWEPFDKTVSSLRLDAVMKEIYHLSRKDASAFIKKMLVKVNHKIVDDSKFAVQEGDLISVRGKGRSKLIEIHGKTRKDKWRITAAKLK
jgi:RNA-binding protein YlmH